jgi:hypothetical protein
MEEKFLERTALARCGSTFVGQKYRMSINLMASLQFVCV